MPPLIAVSLTALLFYAVIPGIGAFIVRSRWRHFRRTLVAAAMRPMVTLDAVQSDEGALSDGAAGAFRFLGALEGLQGDDFIWVRGPRLSVCVDMREAEIYLLPPADRDLSDEPPRHLAWRQMTSLTEGTRIFVAGRLAVRDGRINLVGTAAEPVLVVVYDGAERTVLRRGIWSARQRNEYWNRFSPASLAAGMVALTTIGYVLMRSSMDRIAAVLSVSLAVFPVLPLLPPGVALFFVFRVLWRRGRLLRAYRDVIRLPLRHLGDGERVGSLPEGQPYALRYVDREAAAGYREHGVAITDPLDRGEREVSVVAVCGQYRTAEEPLQVPDDPMSELVVIDGDPAALAHRCERGARRLELLSALAVAVALIGNLYLVFWLLLLATR